MGEAKEQPMAMGNVSWVLSMESTLAYSCRGSFSGRGGFPVGEELHINLAVLLEGEG